MYQNTVSIECVTLAPAPITVQDVMDNINSGNKDVLPTDAMQMNVKTKNTMWQNVIFEILWQDTMW